MRRRIRFSFLQKCADDFEGLLFVDRATAQLESYFAVLGNWRGLGERADVFGARVDDVEEFVHVLKIVQRLDAACRRARADGDEGLGILAHLLNPFSIVRRGD